jgi:hypothetical protein
LPGCARTGISCRPAREDDRHPAAPPNRLSAYTTSTGLRGAHPPPRFRWQPGKPLRPVRLAGGRGTSPAAPATAHQVTSPADGMPVAFIDWDAAQPIKPLADIASAAWTFVPFAPPEQLAEAGFHPLPDLPARLRMFVDAYGLTDRQAILPELRRCIQDEPGPLRWFQRIMANLASALSPNRGALEPPQGIPDRNGDISSDQRRAHDRRQRVARR